MKDIVILTGVAASEAALAASEGCNGMNFRNNQAKEKKQQ